MFLIFDVESKVLNSVFFGSVAFLLLMLVALVAVIRSVEMQESVRREEIFKQALNDFISKDRPSEVVKKALPALMTWWQDKKDQVLAAQQLAIRNQSKIMLGEIASRVGHDIIGSVRNVEILALRTTGLTEKQNELFRESINKIKCIVHEISDHTKKSIEEEIYLQPPTEQINLVNVLNNIIRQKQVQFEDHVEIELEPTSNKTEPIVNLNILEFERSVSNLINNAAEASPLGSKVTVSISYTDPFIEIVIKDVGKGIPLEHLKNIGKKGYSFEKEKGTGIGVFYAKRFFEDLGGHLSIESGFGDGTRVSIHVPMLNSEHS